MTKLKGFQWLRKSIKAQIFVGVFTTGLLSIIPVLFILETRWQSTVMAIGFTLVISAILANVIFNPLLTGLNALETGLLNFKDGEFSGYGTLTFEDGQKYVGNFKDGYFNGFGNLNGEEVVYFNGKLVSY